MLGGTGRTGGRVLTQLLERGVAVRAIVRSAARLPRSAADDPLLTVVEADLLSLSKEDLGRHAAGCDTVISCLGHTATVKGIVGPPFDLVGRALSKLTDVLRGMQPPEPVRLILMSSVSVNRPERADTRRGRVERLVIWMLRGLVAPARDNQRAADFLAREHTPGDRSVEWVVVRPDSLHDGDVSPYRVTDRLVSSIFRPDRTSMANVAHFMVELTTDDSLWQRWRSGMPVIVDEDAKSEHAPRSVG